MSNKETIDQINDLLTGAMLKGTVPWKAEWYTTSNCNAITGHGYRGINALTLPLIKFSRGFKSSLWLTFNQTRQAGGTVKKGEKGSRVYFWKFFKDKKNEKKLIPWMTSYTVFNLDQTENVPANKIKSAPVRVFPAVENYANGPTVIEDGSSPRYVPLTDTVYLPTAWKTAEGKFQTTYHELAHSTGHKTRLDRFTEAGEKYASKEYAREELVAEIASAYACALTGKPWSVESTASYLTSWMTSLEEDPMLIIWASSRAEKASNLILGIKDADQEGEEPNETYQTEASPEA